MKEWFAAQIIALAALTGGVSHAAPTQNNATQPTPAATQQTAPPTSAPAMPAATPNTPPAESMPATPPANPKSKPTSAATPAPPATAAPATKQKPAVKNEESEGEETNPSLIAHMLPFQENWEEATPDEKALFLNIYGESEKALGEQWDKASPEERQNALRNNPLLSARALKHRWAATTPEERAAFLEAHPRTSAKIKAGWDEATPEQRKTLAQEHPFLERSALYHSWAYATPQEKMAFLAAHPKLLIQLKSKWISATPEQKTWYQQNYAGLVDALAHNKPWAQVTFLERVAFLDANPGISDRLREEWQKAKPEERAAMIRKWVGWPLKELTTRVEKPETTPISAGKKHAGKKSKGLRTPPPSPSSR